MPNHVTNRLTAPAGTFDHLIGVETEKGRTYLTFDFNQIISCPAIIPLDSTALRVKCAAEIALGLIDFANNDPMPPDPLSPVNLSQSASILHRANATRQLVEGGMAKDFSDDDFAAFIGYLRAWKETGYLDWHDWNVANWGTKWNAYSVEKVSPTIIKFDTAWNAPHPVIKRFADAAGCVIKHEWADEDTGSNVGFRTYDNGSSEGEELSGTREGYELAFDIRSDADSWKWNGETYVHRDDD